MKREAICPLETVLGDIPMGMVAVERYDASTAATPLFQELQAQTDGRGKIEIYSVFPGIEAAFIRFLASQALFHHGATPSGLEIYHCRSGRIGWNMENGASVYLGSGDLSLHSAGCCAESVMTFPTGCSEGILFSINLNQLEQDIPSILKEAGLSPRILYEKFCQGKPLAVLGSEEMDCIFSPLYRLSEKWRLPYLQLKVQELLLSLFRLETQNKQELTPYVPQQTELIREIHDFITAHLDQRFTIEELSRRYPINTSSLKEVFKAVYGQPIATYMKQYRVRRAMELLRETDKNIADIAAQVGYETQGKFTQAFKDVTHQLPTQYRKQF